MQRRAAAAAVRYMATFPERMRVKEYSRSLCVIITYVVEECRPSTHKNSNQLGITAFFRGVEFFKNSFMGCEKIKFLR